MAVTSVAKPNGTRFVLIPPGSGQKRVGIKPLYLSNTKKSRLRIHSPAIRVRYRHRNETCLVMALNTGSRLKSVCLLTAQSAEMITMTSKTKRRIRLMSHIYSTKVIPVCMRVTGEALPIRHSRNNLGLYRTSLSVIRILSLKSP